MSRALVLASAALGLACFSEPGDPDGQGDATGTGSTGMSMTSAGPASGDPSDPTSTSGPTATSASTMSSSADVTGTTGGCSAGATHRMAISVAPLDQAFTDVPLLVRLDPERIDYALAAPDGADVRFYRTNCETLPHELETWNVGGVSDIWVALPSTTDNEVFWLEIGDPRAQASTATDVWLAYVGVWHLAEDLSSGDTVAHDATGNMLDGHQHGTTGLPIASIDDGIVGRASGFGGFDLTVADDPMLALSGSVTIEAWVREGGAVPLDTFRIVLRRSGGPGGNDPYWLAAATPTSELPTFGVFPTGGDAAPHTVSLGVGLEQGAWTYVVGTWDVGGEATILHNAMDAVSVSATDMGPGLGGPLFIGSELGAQLDEVRLMADAPAPEWVALQYQTARDMLLTYGPLDPL